MEGKEDFILTGQLGEVMRESARAGLSWTRAHAAELGIEREMFEKNTLHIHVPAGGIPKDGPSAGITMATAMVSALTGIPVRKDVAMTGEITLRGRVLPIGGLKSKILAAHLAGAEIVILPSKNEKDLRDIPEEIRKQIKLVLVRHDGPGPRGGPPAQAEGRSPPSRRRSSRAATRSASRQPSPGSGGRPFPPTDQPPVVVQGLTVPDGGVAIRSSRAHGARGRPGPPPAAPRSDRGSGPRARTDHGAVDDDRPAFACPPEGLTMEYQDYYEILGVPRTRLAGRHQEGLPQARPGAPPGPQRRRQGRRAAVQGRQRGQRRPVRPGEAQAVRPPGRELGGSSSAPAAARAAPIRSGRAGRSRGFGSAGSAGGAGRAGQSGGVRYEFRTSSGGEAGFSDFFRMFFSGAAAGAGAATGQRDFAADRAARPARRAGTVVRGHPRRDGPGRRGDRWDRRAIGRVGAQLRQRPAVGRPRSRRRPRSPSRRPTTAPSAWSRSTASATRCRSRAGVDTGSRIRLSGKGPEGRDVVVTVKLAPHALFTRRGADLERELPGHPRARRCSAPRCR